jgi:hypothetical protein
MGAYAALYDANVLYPAPLRDLLMHLAGTGLFRARWTEQIHAEWIAGLVRDQGRDPAKLNRTREMMNKAVPDCLITGYESLIETLHLPDSDDRHVLAAAIVGNVDAIVTMNLRDFPESALRPFHIEAQHPDDFIVCQMDLAPATVCAAVKKQRQMLTRPAYSVEEFLDRLTTQQLPQTVARLREFSDLI